MAATTTGMRMMMRHARWDRAAHLATPTNEATCAEPRAVAWTYLDHESPWWERRWVRAHTARCDHCRAYLQFQRAFLRAVRAGLHHEPADEALRERIRAALAWRAPSSESLAEPAGQD